MQEFPGSISVGAQKYTLSTQHRNVQVGGLCTIGSKFNENYVSTTAGDICKGLLHQGFLLFKYLRIVYLQLNEVATYKLLEREPTPTFNEKDSRIVILITISKAKKLIF